MAHRWRAVGFGPDELLLQNTHEKFCRPHSIANGRIARAIIEAGSMNPVVLLDEPSDGIMPVLVQQIADSLARINREQGLTILIVEQNVKALTTIADRVYVLRHGEMVLEESGDQARARTEWWHLF